MKLEAPSLEIEVLELENWIAAMNTNMKCCIESKLEACNGTMFDHTFQRATTSKVVWQKQAELAEIQK